jgi:hypothetical protein
MNNNGLKLWLPFLSGTEYVRKNMERLRGTTGVLIPVGYELIFPALMEDAKALGLDLPYETDTVQMLKEMGRTKRERYVFELTVFMKSQNTYFLLVAT